MQNQSAESLALSSTSFYARSRSPSPRRNPKPDSQVPPVPPIPAGLPSRLQAGAGALKRRLFGSPVSHLLRQGRDQRRGRLSSHAVQGASSELLVGQNDKDEGRSVESLSELDLDLRPALVEREAEEGGANLDRSLSTSAVLPCDPKSEGGSSRFPPFQAHGQSLQHTEKVSESVTRRHLDVPASLLSGPRTTTQKRRARTVDSLVEAGEVQAPPAVLQVGGERRSRTLDEELYRLSFINSRAAHRDTRAARANESEHSDGEGDRTVDNAHSTLPFPDAYRNAYTSPPLHTTPPEFEDDLNTVELAELDLPPPKYEGPGLNPVRKSPLGAGMIPAAAVRDRVAARGVERGQVVGPRVRPLPVAPVRGRSPGGV